MEPSTLQIVWFLLVGILLTGYAILDGFDLGVGVLSLFGKPGDERRIYLNAIGPVWDGNEVWLVTGVGALFAAFPPVYATVFSGFYLAIVLALVGLIFRAVSIEFRSKVDSRRWQTFWDWSFGLGSLLVALVFGVAVGNILQGVPLTQGGEYAGTFVDLVSPYALLVGALTVVMFVCHGALFMTNRCDGELRERMFRLASRAWVAWTALFVAATVATFVVSPWALDRLTGNPLFWLGLLALTAALLYVPLAIGGRTPGRAFLASSTAITALMGLLGLSLYPRLVPALGDLTRSLTIANASASPKALSVMLVIALVGMPLVIGYTAVIYRVFRGKVELGPDSY